MIHEVDECEGIRLALREPDWALQIVVYSRHALEVCISVGGVKVGRILNDSD